MSDQSSNNVEFNYGKTAVRINKDLNDCADIFLPQNHPGASSSSAQIINEAIADFSPSELTLSNKTTVGIAVNDPTRPIPNHLLLPPLLDWLHANDISQENITFYIATGTHRGPSTEQIKKILRPTITQNYRTIVHNCDDVHNLANLGCSSAGTPIHVNKRYLEQDLKIVVGHIEPHHFMGYSGGVKSAVIGLGGRETISVNHKMLTLPACKMGNFYNNPMRIDIEEIGNEIGVDIALNVILDDRKYISAAFFGVPYDVMEKGIKISAHMCEVDTKVNYDLVVCSAGGYPKDINLYQAQKAITHACTFLKDEGVIILFAECSQGIGSTGFGQFFEGKTSPDHVIRAFEEGPFVIGPHKAYQLSIQTKKHKIILISDLKNDSVRKMFLEPASNLNDALKIAENWLPAHPRIALLPFATHVMNRT